MSRILEAAKLVRDAGGELVGRTRLQKLAFLLETTGLGSGFTFEYRRYGPYSEELANAARDAKLLGMIEERENPTSWGGLVSTFSTNLAADQEVPAARLELARAAVGAGSIELELAATALFLHHQRERQPWLETARRKPDKAEHGRLTNAKALYARLRQIDMPKPLPELAE